MNARHPVEALLRPPVELWSAVVATAAGAIAILAPWALMMTPSIAWTCATVLGLIAVRRTHQGLVIMRYQRNLRRLPTYLTQVATYKRPRPPVCY